MYNISKEALERLRKEYSALTPVEWSGETSTNSSVFFSIVLIIEFAFLSLVKYGPTP